MFEARNLLYFKEYYFENGNPAKPKYFLILKSDENGVMIISLPSSKDFIPENVTKKHGCINIPDKQIGCYFFQKNITITDCNFSFPLDTYIYSGLITKIEITKIKYIYTPKDYKLIGKIKEKEYFDIIKCLKNSPNINSKFKKIL